MSCPTDCPFSGGSLVVRLEPGEEILDLRSRYNDLNEQFQRLHGLYQMELQLNARLISLLEDNGIKWRKIK